MCVSILLDNNVFIGRSIKPCQARRGRENAAMKRSMDETDAEDSMDYCRMAIRLTEKDQNYGIAAEEPMTPR